MLKRLRNTMSAAVRRAAERLKERERAIYESAQTQGKNSKGPMSGTLINRAMKAGKRAQGMEKLAELLDSKKRSK